MNELQINNMNGELTISSIEVAELIGKPHSDVLKMLDGQKDKEGKVKIVGIIPTLLKGELPLVDYFIESTYKDRSGKENKCYECTKMGCEMLANKLTGEKGILFTAKYVNKFNKMEQYIKEQNTPSYMIDNPIKRAEKWIEEYKEKQLLEVQNDKLNKEIDYKENVIIGLVDDISLAEKRARIKQVINHNANGRYAERYNLLYKEFQDKYHIDLKRRMDNLELKSIVKNYLGEEIKITKKIKTNKMEYIDKILCKTPELYEIVCKLFENDIEELMKEWESTII